MHDEKPIERFKACSKCGAVLPLTEFYKSAKSKDGLEGRCKLCKKAYRAQQWLDKKPEEEARKKRWNEENPERVQAYTEAWQRRNIAKVKAARKARYARTKGRLERESCEACGSDVEVDGHHEDYARPLDVQWLCRSCHAAHHRVRRLNEIEAAR
jgi:hypothetical protein